MKKNLVLGLINYYTFYEFQKFVKSLRNSGYRDDIVFFVGDGMSPFSIRKLKKFQVKIIKFNTIYELPEGNLAGKKYQFNPQTTHNNYRWYLYYDFLEKNRLNYNQIFLTDIKDVYFQKSPFLIKSSQKLIFFLEGKDKTIGEDVVYNSKWVEHIYGKEGLERIKNNFISCCGTILGYSEEIFRYVKHLLEEYDKISDCSITLDQGIHNYLLYTNVFKEYDLIPNEAGEVLTIANERNYIVGNDNIVRTLSGDVFKVIHQFDRIDSIVNLTNYLFSEVGFLNWLYKKLYRIDLTIHRLLLKFKI